MYLLKNDRIKDKEHTHLYSIQKMPELGADEGAACVGSVDVQPHVLLVT